MAAARFFTLGCIYLVVCALLVVGISGVQQHHRDAGDSHRNYREKVLETTYHGLIKENETLVELMPQLRVDEAKVCGFHILRNSHYNGDIPFQIELEGSVGVIQAVHSLNCEKRKTYKFEVAAVLCDTSISGLYSKPAQVRISVIDVNEYAPTFQQPSYTVQVDEGRLYKEIVRLEAVDKDCTPRYGDVCKYEILQRDGEHHDESGALFDIDGEGSIRNLQPLSFKRAHNHILSVIAYDCAMKASAPVMVNIKVNRVCEARLTGVPERIDYMANSADENVALFPNVGLELCDLLGNVTAGTGKAPKYLVETEVELRTSHISYGCDRDSLVARCDMKEQKVNGHGQFVDLLARDRDWTRELTADEVLKAKVNDDTIYHFDGTTGAVVPNAAINSFDFSSSSSGASTTTTTTSDEDGVKFSILTMFRHRNNLLALNGADKKATDAVKHQKEHLLCTADNHKMNRHHMALFVRNCRLIFLLRRNSHAPQMNIFAPAEWRWRIPQVCDNEWHTYVINVNTNSGNASAMSDDEMAGGVTVELFVDGEPIKDGHDMGDAEHPHGQSPEVIDDWPLHAAHGVGTTLTIGACYQGSESRMKHFFNGDMAQLKLALNYNFDRAQIQCGLDCREFLQVNGVSEMARNDVRTTLNRQRNVVKIEASTPKLAEKMLRLVQYTNRKQEPTIGRRNLVIRTKIQLRDDDEQEMYHQLPTIDSYIMVNGAQNGGGGSMDKKIWPRIVIQGNENHLVSYVDIKTGVKIMDNLLIEVKSDGVEDGKTDAESSARPTAMATSLKSGIIGHDDNKWNDNSVNMVDDTEEPELSDDDGNDSGKDVLKRLQFLDNCQLTIFPNLNADHEEIKFLFLNQTVQRDTGKDATVDADKGDKSSFFYNDINVELSATGLRLTGYDSASNYRFILKNLLYINRKPAYYLNRIFKLKCSQLDGRLESNEFQLTLTVLHPKQQPTAATAASTAAKDHDKAAMGGDSVAASKVEAMFSHSMIHRGALIDESQSKLRHNGDESVSMVHQGHAHLLIIAICACFVLIIGGLGVARLKNRVQLRTHKGMSQKGGPHNGNVEGGDFKLLSQDELELMEEDGKHQHHSQQNQLDWDDTPLTITVNPMQNWTDEDEEQQGLEYLMATKKSKSLAATAAKRALTTKMGLGWDRHLVEEVDENEDDDLDDEAQDDDSSEEDVDSEEEEDDDEEDDSDSEDQLDDDLAYSSNNTSAKKEGRKNQSMSGRGSSMDDHQLEWDNSTL